MTPDERNLINGLFDRLRKADANAPAKDREAEDFIRQLTTQVPGAAYLLTQTTLVQEHALTNAQARIADLEKQLTQVRQQPSAAASGSSGGFLSGLFGGHASAPPPAPQPQQQTPPPMPVQAPPYPSTVNMAPSAGGGFLRGALGTAAGVAGGAMLFEGIQNLLGHNAGPFGGFGGVSSGGGFLGGAGRPEVVNNYYGDTAGEGRHEASGGAGGGDANDNVVSGGADLGDPIPQGGADQPANPGYEDTRYDGGNLDTSNPFDKPVDDQSFLGTNDGSSLDNNYDTDNTDAGSSSDFVGGDSDDNSGAA